VFNISFILSHLRGCVTCKTGFLIEWLDLLTPYSHNLGLQAITALSLIYTLQFTVTYSLGFSVFTNHILATDLRQYVTLNHIWSFIFRSLISLLPLFCSCQFRRLSSIQFLCSQAHAMAGWHQKLKTPQWTVSTELFFITTLYRPRRKHNLSIGGKAGLQRHCLAM
jgi:hypothetical protein